MNPNMGAMVTRDWGISFILTYLGQQYQDWILFNVNVPEDYHWCLFIYSYPNIDFYPFQDFFSSWEKDYYFYFDDMIKNNFIKNKVRFWTELNISAPIGFELYQLEYEMHNKFGVVPLFHEIIRMFMVLVFGKMPQLPPVLILIVMYSIMFLFVLFFWNTYLYIYKCDVLFVTSTYEAKFYNGLFSKK
jgi:hypothetical protein